MPPAQSHRAESSRQGQSHRIVEKSLTPIPMIHRAEEDEVSSWTDFSPSTHFGGGGDGNILKSKAQSQTPPPSLHPTVTPDDSSADSLNVATWASFEHEDNTNANNKQPPPPPPRHSTSTTFGFEGASNIAPNANKPNGSGNVVKHKDTSPITDQGSAGGDEETGAVAATTAAPRKSNNTEPSDSASASSRCSRKHLLIAAGVCLLVAIVGGVCGALLGVDGGGGGVDTASNQVEQQQQQQQQQSFEADSNPDIIVPEINEDGSFSTIDDESNEPDDDGVLDSIPTPEPSPGPTSSQILATMSPTDSPTTSPCSDDPNWRLVIVDRFGNTYPRPYGCSWVAQNDKNCNMDGVSTIASVNRVGGEDDEEAETEVIMDAFTACPLTCGKCPSSPAASIAANIQQTETLPTKYRPPPTRSPTTAPIRYTKNPTRAPTRKPTPAPIPIPVPRPTPLPPTPKPPTPMPITTESTNSKFICKSTAIDTTSEISLPFEGAVQVGSVDATKVGEASGLVASTQKLGILWTHNDAPKRPNQPNRRNAIYAINAKGGAIVAEYEIGGVRNIDWEDIAYGLGPQSGVKYIYIGDIGDNLEARDHIIIYRVREPDISSGGVHSVISDVDKLVLTYPDRQSRNSEAFIFDPISERFYLFTKLGGQFWSTPSRWGYGDASMTLNRAGLMHEFRRQPLVGADISTDGTEILLKYYGSVKYLCRSLGERVDEVFKTHDSVKMDYDRRNEHKGEAVAWSQNGFYTLSEAKYNTVPLFYYKRV